MRCAKTTCNIMLFRFLAEMGPPGSKNGYFGAKCGMQKSHILEVCCGICIGMLWYAVVCAGMLWYAVVCAGMCFKVSPL